MNSTGGLTSPFIPLALSSWENRGPDPACKHAVSGVHNVFARIGANHQFQSWKISHELRELGPRSGSAFSGTVNPRGPRPVPLLSRTTALEDHAGFWIHQNRECVSIQVSIKHKEIKMKNKKNERDACFKKILCGSKNYSYLFTMQLDRSHQFLTPYLILLTSLTSLASVAVCDPHTRSSS